LFCLSIFKVGQKHIFKIDANLNFFSFIN
jgi:hypothetical protein